jgi:hypothetical protein
MYCLPSDNEGLSFVLGNVWLTSRLDTFIGWRFRASNLDGFGYALEHPKSLFDAELVGSAQLVKGGHHLDLRWVCAFSFRPSMLAMVGPFARA